MTLGKQLLEPAANATVPPGTTVRYRLTYACNGVAQPSCGDISISDTLPPELEIVGCDFPLFGSLTCPVGGNTVTALRTNVSTGTAGEAFITTRVRPGAGAATGVFNSANLTFTNNPGGQPLPINADSAPINISAASQRNYSITKQQFDPIPTLVISDQATFVTDRVRFCAAGGIDQVSLNGIQIFDDTPPGATNIRTVIPAGAPPITETIVGNRVTWTVPAARIAIDTLYPPGSNLGAQVCLDFFVTYDLPAGAGPAPDRAHVRADDPVYCSAAGLGTPPVGDTGNPQCFGQTPGDRGGPDSNLTPFSKSGNDATPSDTPNNSGIGRINWRINARFQSNIGLQDVQFFDVLPTVNTGVPPRLQVSSFTLGNWNSGAPNYDVVADVFVSNVEPAPTASCGDANWTEVATAAPSNNAITISSGLGGITGICWRFANANTGPGLPPANEVPRDFGFTTQPVISQPVPSTINPPPLPGSIDPQNCFIARWNAGGAQFQQTCRTQRIEDARPGLAPVKTVQSAPSSLRPLDEIVWRVGVDHAVGDSTGDIVDPVIVDVLPPELEFIDTTVIQPGSPTPVITTVPDFTFGGVPGHTLVRIAYTGSFPRTAAQMPRIDIRTRIRAGALNGSYTNRIGVFSGDPNSTCSTSFVADADNIDGNGATTEYCAGSAGFNILQAAVLDGTKWVSGPGPYENPLDDLVDDPTEPPAVASAACPVYADTFAGAPGVGVDTPRFTRFPCVARTDFGAPFNYRVRIQNAGNVAFDNYVFYEVLPFIGDTGVGEPQTGVTRNSRFRPLLTGAPTLVAAQTTANIAGNFLIEYSGSSNPCRPEVSSDDDTSGWQGTCANDWSATPPGGDFANVRAIRIRAFVDPNGTFNGPTDNWGRLETAVFDFPMAAPVFVAPTLAGGALPSVVGDTNVFNPAWVSFAHRAYRATPTPLNPNNLLPTAEPVKAGVILPERYRLGNRVWRDTNNNGVLDQGEAGIDGVELRLCRDTDGIPGPSAGDLLVGSTVTTTVGGRSGKYRFDELLRQNDYYLGIPSVQPTLVGLQVSTNNNSQNPNNRVDNDNNAQGTPAAAICGGGAGFVTSPGLSLGDPSANEPTNERIFSGSNTDDDPDNGGGTDLWPDRMSNYSVDVGFAGSIDNADLGDLPDTGNNTGPGNYRTLLVNNGPSHLQTTGLTLGLLWDAELDGQPGVGANGDDLNGLADEDGVIDPSQLQFFRGQLATVDVRVVNDSGSTARLCSYVDWNADGDFGDTVAGTAELAPTISIPSGTGPGGTVVSVNWGSVPFAGATIDPTYARFRLSLDGGACSTAFANGPSSSGEVEDYRASIIAIDRGDLPDGLPGLPSYPTLVASNGASHIIRSGLRLGALVDAEIDGQPSAAADGDDSAPAGQPDDEDGIVIADLVMRAGGPNAVRFNATNLGGAQATVCGFIDFNGNGVLGEPGELAQATVAAGANGVNGSLLFTVPANAVRNTYARFRIYTEAANPGATCSPEGALNDGEVEDYAVLINAFDLGDLPDTGAGTGPGNYRTLLANGGARHLIQPGFPASPNLFMGLGVDAEFDGQPGINADGDDLAGIDDEDGVSPAQLQLVALVPAQIDVQVNNLTGSAARLCGFLDLNGDGVFDAVGEVASAIVPAGTVAGSASLGFGAPALGAPPVTYARFRLSTDTAGACSAGGDAPDGEVEDYRVTITERMDFGDLPDTGPGTGAGNYATLLINNGPRHVLRPGLLMGTLIDDELDGLPSVGADGDDLSGIDDEDGVNLIDLSADNLVAGRPATVRVQVSNTTGDAARVCGYIDFNGDGVFDGPGELAQIAVPTGSVDAQFGLSFAVPASASGGATYARFRLSTEPGLCTPASANGQERDGEVEDYLAQVRRFDFGDLPDTGAGQGPGNYATLLANDGPRHVIVDGLFLGDRVDAEGDGQPSLNADGDDLAGIDDEDGVTFLQPYDLGSPARVNVRATNLLAVPAQVCGFIDWNDDGDFDDASERASIPVPAGTTDGSLQLEFGLVPADAVASPYARFRLSTDPDCSPAGEASDGEVEDYRIGTSGVGALALGDQLWVDTNNNCLFEAGEQGLPGLRVNLYVDTSGDGQPDGAALATQLTDINGRYLFTQLQPGEYIVEVERPATYLGSTGSGFPYSPSGSCAAGVDPNDDVDNDDNGFEVGPLTRSLPVTLVAETKPGPPDFNTNPTVDFGFLLNFDLELNKRLADGQPAQVLPNQVVNYLITVRNEGTVPAATVEVTDRFPAGFTLESTDWTLAADGLSATRSFGPLLPGASIDLPISLRAGNAQVGSLRNIAEITRAEDDSGLPIRDIDSVPGNSVDNEDDQDGVDLFVGIPRPVPIPATGLLSLFGLMLGMLWMAWMMRSRMRQV
ncbi:MAG: GEVED domain-containing protein [Aquimonas sp.]|nr:GEVED domain-containing protein [Aquimonas sp.]